MRLAVEDCYAFWWSHPRGRSEVHSSSTRVQEKDITENAPVLFQRLGLQPGLKSEKAKDLLPTPVNTCLETQPSPSVCLQQQHTP